MVKQTGTNGGENPIVTGERTIPNPLPSGPGQAKAFLTAGETIFSAADANVGSLNRRSEIGVDNLNGRDVSDTSEMATSTPRRAEALPVNVKPDCCKEVLVMAEDVVRKTERMRATIKAILKVGMKGFKCENAVLKVVGSD